MDEDEEYRRRLRRAAQRARRESESIDERAVRRRKDATYQRAARQQVNSNEPSRSARPSTTNWWDRIGILNRSQSTPPLRLQWNRTCKICGIMALTGERINDRCFVCGPKGIHYQPRLPPYPQEWNYFINNTKTAGISRKLNNLFAMSYDCSRRIRWGFHEIPGWRRCSDFVRGPNLPPNASCPRRPARH
ncbi:hypothetical protein B0H13DRAFT_2516261 [Mycena leptocephala]|nr:hypothetical protein B0H13DRAFT_2516261 [Mycena leptocephala]